MFGNILNGISTEIDVCLTQQKSCTESSWEMSYCGHTLHCSHAVPSRDWDMLKLWLVDNNCVFGLTTARQIGKKAPTQKHLLLKKKDFLKAGNRL